MANSLQHHQLQHARLPCASPSPRVCSNSCLLSQGGHQSILFSVIPYFSCLLSFLLSGTFQWVGFLHQVAKVLELQLLHQSFQWIFRVISFRTDWFDPRAVQGILKSLLQHYNSKTSILWCSAFFMVQLSHPYMTTGKAITLTIQNFLGKVMSQAFNMLSRLITAFLPRSKCLLISWLLSPSSVILEPKKIKSFLFLLFPHLYAMKWLDWMPWS